MVTARARGEGEERRGEGEGEGVDLSTQCRGEDEPERITSSGWRPESGRMTSQTDRRARGETGSEVWETRSGAGEASGCSCGSVGLGLGFGQGEGRAARGIYGVGARAVVGSGWCRAGR